jgi:membrane fusion protein, multidrug efflux system
MKRNVNQIILQLLLVFSALVLHSCSGGDKSKNQAGQAGGQEATVHAYIIDPVSVNEEVVASGSFLAWEEIELKPEIQGRVTGIYFKEGQELAEGSLLIKLFDEDLQAGLRKAIAQREMARLNLERSKSLHETGGVSKQEYDQAYYTLQELEAEVMRIQSELRKTEIRAPWSGQVGLRYVSQGAIVSPGQIMAVFRKVKQLKIDFSLPERFAGKVSKGTPFTAKIDYHDIPFEGKVFAIEPSVEENSRVIKLRGEVKNENGIVKPGTFATVSIFSDTIHNAIMLPDRAIVPVIKGKQVYVIKNGVVEVVSVETGIRNDKQVQVIGKGIAIGDTVLTTGLMQVKPGMKANILKIENRK